MSAEEETRLTLLRGQPRPELCEPETQMQSQETCPGRKYFWEGGCAQLDPTWRLLQRLWLTPWALSLGKWMDQGLLALETRFTPGWIWGDSLRKILRSERHICTHTCVCTLNLTCRGLCCHVIHSSCVYLFCWGSSLNLLVWFTSKLLPKQLGYGVQLHLRWKIIEFLSTGSFSSPRGSW